uniref:Tyrosine-protein phosphatase domain-containing protein n=1 Tax=Panagrolaimus superbus TaxID=310955 RepID=A0A914Z604_9BILA
MTCAKGIQGILQEFDDIKATSYMPGQIKKDTFNKHPDKNRYKDTFCLEDTRVILKWPEGNSMDYIHANWVQNLPEMSKDIICTQGPTEKTLDDFWRMIWQEKCICIIMLCGIMESGKKKYEQVCCFDFGDTVDYYFKLYIFMQIH